MTDGAERFEAWLLDADYVTRDDRAVVRLWVKQDDSDLSETDSASKNSGILLAEGSEGDFDSPQTAGGSLEDETVSVVTDSSFEPYFYCVPSSDAGAEEAAEELRSLDVELVEIVDRRMLGEPVELARVTAHHPQDVPELRNRATELESVDSVREARVPFAVRYIIDTDLVPMGRHRFETEDGELVSAEPVESEGLPELDVMAFDCEMLSRGSAPSAERDPIVVISTASEDGSRMFTAAADEGEPGEAEGEADMIREFVEYLDEVDPDVVTTYNGDDFDWPYLRDRAELHGVTLDVGRDGSEPTFRGGGRGSVDLRGRLNVDMYRVAERDLGGLETKSLEDVAEHLGVVDKEDRAAIDSIDVEKYWSDPERREELLRYARHDAESTLGVAEELLPLQLQLSRLVHRFPDDVSKMGRGRQVEWFLISEAKEHGEVVPKPRPSSSSYAGGLVLEPETGLHEDVVCLDFSSMYPSIMIAYNISPDTLVTGEEGEHTASSGSEGSNDGSEDRSEVHEAPFVGHRFRKEPDGFFKRVLQELIETRNEAKQRMRDTKDPEERRLADIRQRTLKVLANSFYGYTGWSAASWYRQECAEATAAWGRHLIQRAVDEAEDRGYEVLYGDTDSLFLKGPDEEEAEAFAAELTETLPLELELEDFYDVIFFTEVKKRYAGLTRDGEISVKGLEVQRGDWCDLAKEIQSGVLERLLRDRDPEAAADLVRSTVAELKAGEVPLEKLLIRKTLTKRIESYKSKQAHVRAAEKLRENGYEIEPGQKVEYVIVRDTGKLSDRAYPVEMFERYEDGALLLDDRRYVVDTDYYVEKQVVPSAHRILDHFGYDEGYLKGEPRQSSLGGF